MYDNSSLISGFDVLIHGQKNSTGEAVLTAKPPLTAQVFFRNNLTNTFTAIIFLITITGDFHLLCAFALLILLFVNRKTKRIQFNSLPLFSSFLQPFSFIMLCSLISPLFMISSSDHNYAGSFIYRLLFRGIFLSTVMQDLLKMVSGFAILFCATFIFYSSQEYLLINSGHNDSYAQKLTGEATANYARPDELVFTNIGISPVLMWHAQRNLMPAVSIKDCVKTLNSLRSQKGNIPESLLSK